VIQGGVVTDAVFVDLKALQSAADGIADTFLDIANRRVSDLGPPSSSFGHDGLAGTVSDFCDRWDIGVMHLASDAAEVADRLQQCVLSYGSADQRTQQSLDGILRLPGPDPAAT
jgi:hypothetical protein